MTRKELEELKAKQNHALEWLDNRLRFRAIKNRFSGKDDIKRETEIRKVRKITEKKDM